MTLDESDRKALQSILDSDDYAEYLLLKADEAGLPVDKLAEELAGHSRQARELLARHFNSEQ